MPDNTVSVEVPAVHLFVAGVAERDEHDRHVGDAEGQPAMPAGGMPGPAVVDVQVPAGSALPALPVVPIAN